MQLNAQQQRVVNDLTHHILLQAPAGTGKTRVLACRTAHILETGAADGSQILCLTFTNRACKELKNRIQDLCGEKGLAVVVKTIHSFCYSLIKEESKRTSDTYHDFLIYDDADCKELIASLPVWKNHPGGALQMLQNYLEIEKKRRVLPSLHSFSQFRGEAARWLEEYGSQLLTEYEAALMDNHAVDFTDLITQAYTLLQDNGCCTRWQERFRFIAIDEMQDTSEIEYAVVSRLFGQSRLLLCGDIFQTIYEWRGSYPKEILESFSRTYQPEKITFTINYRSTQILLQAAKDCLVYLFGAPQVTKIYPQPSQPIAAETGTPVRLHESDTLSAESRWIRSQLQNLPEATRLKSCILVRTNKEAQAISTLISSQNHNLASGQQLPVTSIDQFRLFKRQECKDVLAFLRLLVNPHDNLSLHRILLRFVPRIGARTIATIESPSYRKLGLTLTDFVDPGTQANGDPYGLLLSALQAGRIVVFDVESTGTDTANDEIIQIAAIRLNAQGEAAEKFNTYLRASKSVGSSYLVHHISDEKLQQEGKDPKEALLDFLDFAKDAVIVGHNVTYDLSILYSELRRLHLEKTGIFPYYDTLDIYRRFYPNLLNHKLETLSRIFPIKHQPSHDAYDDILATAGLLGYAIKENIQPLTAARRASMAMYLPLFAPFAKKLAALHQASYLQRPKELIAQVMTNLGVKAWYQNHATAEEKEHEYPRVENIRNLYRLANETDEASMNSRDALGEFLKLASLSNSELDSLLKKHPQIPIITVHQAKGLEFENVFLAGLCDGIFPLKWPIINDDLDEEKRLFYVAVTRAKKRLYLSWHKGYQKKTYLPSRFLQAFQNADYCKTD